LYPDAWVGTNNMQSGVLLQAAWISNVVLGSSITSAPYAARD